LVGFSVDLAASRNLLLAVAAQGAALLMSGDRIGGHRQPLELSYAAGACNRSSISTARSRTLMFRR
jgi:hypothetical protein